MEEFELTSLSDFYKWKHNIEKKTCSSYVQQRGQIKRPNKDIFMYFDCNRSGEYTPHGKGLRRVKSNLSKIGSKCASNIRIKVTDSGNRVIVKYSKIHDKHSIELEHLHLPKSVRASIADQLSVGVSVPQIITAIRSVYSNSKTKHRYVIKRKDILNIKRDFNIKQDNFQYHFDRASLKSWAECLLKRGYVSPVLPSRETDHIYCMEYTNEPTIVTSNPPKKSNVTESPVSKAQAFIQLYQQNKCDIGEKNSSKIHELLNSLITLCKEVKNSSTLTMDPSPLEQILRENIEQAEEPLVVSKKDILLMHNYFKQSDSEDMGKNVTEELFELEEVFEESAFYEDMLDENLVELDKDMLDEVLDIHTEFDHNYL